MPSEMLGESPTRSDAISALPADFEAQLLSGAQALGVPLTEQQALQLRAYSELLIAQNARQNLTRIPPDQFVVLHYLDSLAVLTAVAPSQGARLLDVGTGAGLPGLVLKIARPDLRVSLLDSTRKKLVFVQGAVEALGLREVVCVHARAEDLARDSAYHTAYDVVTARAVAPAERLVGWVMPFVTAGGRAVLLKGADVQQELAAARPAMRRAGARLEEVKTVALPGGLVRSLVVLSRAVPPRGNSGMNHLRGRAPR